MFFCNRLLPKSSKVKLIYNLCKNRHSISNSNVLKSKSPPLDIRILSFSKCRPVRFPLWNLFSTAASIEIENDPIGPKKKRLYNTQYEFLSNTEAYNKLLFQPKESHPNSATFHKAVVEFLKISEPDGQIIDPKYEVQVTSIISSLKELSDDDLLQVLYHWTKFPKTKRQDQLFSKFWRPIDKECLRRAVERHFWMSDINYLMVDLWYRLGLATYSNFHWQFVKQSLRRVDKLRRDQIIRFCFHLSLTKDLPDSISLYDLIYNLPRILKEGPELSSDELAIICLPFFKEKMVFRDKQLITDILELVKKESKTISSINLGTITQTIRVCGHKGIEDKIDEFLEAFVPEVDRLEVHACCSLAWLGSRGGVRNNNILEALVKRMKGNMKNIHLRNLEYLVLSLCQFNINCEPLYQEVVEELRDLFKDLNALTNDVSKCGRLLPVILSHLAIWNIYPRDLIALVFSEEFLNRFYGPRMFVYKPELLILDQNVMLEVKDYEGPCLSQKSRGYLLKKNMRWVDPPIKPVVDPYQLYCRQVYKSLQDVFESPDLVQLCNILPHHQSIDAIFCTNNSGELIPIPESFKIKPDFEPKFLEVEDKTEEIQYHVFLINFWEAIICFTDELQGKEVMMRRQIENLGYKTHSVSHTQWKKLTSPEEQKSYLISVLKNKIVTPSPSQLLDKQEAISL